MPCGIRRGNLPADELCRRCAVVRRYRLIPHQHQIRQNSVRRFQKTAPQLLARALTRPAIGCKCKRDQPVERDRVRMRHHIRSVLAVRIRADRRPVGLRQLGRNRLRAGIRRLRHLFPTGTAASRKKNRRHTYQYRCFFHKDPHLLLNFKAIPFELYCLTFYQLPYCLSIRSCSSFAALKPIFF